MIIVDTTLFNFGNKGLNFLSNSTISGAGSEETAYLENILELGEFFIWQLPENFSFCSSSEWENHVILILPTHFKSLLI